MTDLLKPTRRAVAASLGATLVTLGRPARAQLRPTEARTLAAAPMRLRLRPEPAPEIDALALEGSVPGPVLRVRQGEEARFGFHNRTERPLSLHWQGVRLANAMDGLGGLTQEPVAPGGTFEYRFTPPDAGTFLVRPLVIGGSAEAAERGLSALLLVEEKDPPRVDQDVALVIDDWKLGPDGTLAPFGDLLERASTGRLGGYLAVGGAEAPRTIQAPPNARLRLRLANACNARSMRIRFDGLKVYVAAIDGQPTDTFEPLRSTLPFAPGTRYDLFVDLGPDPGAKGSVVALLGPGIPLVTVEAAGEPLKPKPPIEALAPNRLLPPEIRLQNAARRTVTIAGGAARGPDGQLTFGGDPSRIWTVNGATGSAASGPLLSVRRGTPVVLQIANQTPTGQPLHLHGHAFRLLHPKDDGWEPYWLDTLLVPENRTVQIAFVADNPGRWALSSTVLERLDAGLWTWFEVT